MCIYYKDQENLTYTSEEHVIPAGVGGMKKLPKRYICDQLDKKENTDPFAVITDYKSKCLTDDWLRIKTRDNSELPIDIILIGVKEGIEENFNCFVLRNPKNTLEISVDRVRAIANGMNFDGKEPEHFKYMPHVQDTGDFDIEYFRVYGKIAFNTLALLKGEVFVMAPYFDEVRKWIAYGGDNNFASMLNVPNALQQSGLPVPQDAHSVLISCSGQMVIANISLYNHFVIQILLSNNFSGQLSLDGFICDWSAKKEYYWHEYLLKTLPDTSNLTS